MAEDVPDNSGKKLDLFWNIAFNFVFGSGLPYILSMNIIHINAVVYL